MTTEAQRRLIDSLLAEKNISNDYLKVLLKQFNKATIEDLSTKEASQLIDSLFKYEEAKKKKILSLCFLDKDRVCAEDCVAYEKGCLILDLLKRFVGDER